jgi:hypothetical protein
LAEWPAAHRARRGCAGWMKTQKFQEDPHWRDYALFYEYFHGDTGAGVGASHQTGWSGVVARIMQIFASSEAHEILAQSKEESVGMVADRPEQ